MKHRAILLISAFIWASSVGAHDIAILTVEAGAVARFETPVGVWLDEITFAPDSTLALYELQGKSRTPVAFQIEQTASGRRLWWILTGATAAKAYRRYMLATGNARHEPQLHVSNRGEALLLTSGDVPVMEYRYGTMLPPQGVAYEYRRSGFIHPLWAPTGDIVTNVQPRDHYHHYGVWNPWTHTTFEGKSVDFWNLGEGQGTVRFAKFLETVEGAVFGGFKALHEHVVFKPGYEKIALNEVFGIKVWNVLDEKSNKVFLWGFTSEMSCASASPLTIDAYRYQGFSIRATPEWRADNSAILTSEGKTRKDADNTSGRWMFCNGHAGGHDQGILFLSYPANFNHPEPMRIWPEAMNDVFMNFCPTKNEDWHLLPGHKYMLRYRVAVYSGEMTAARAEQYWQDFANPPTVRVLKVKQMQ